MVRLLVSYALGLAALTSEAQPLPVEQFFKRPDFTQVKLSPEGTRVATIIRGQRWDTLAVLTIDTRKGRPIANFGDADVLQFYWIDNRRLVVVNARRVEAFLQQQHLAVR